MVRLREAAGLVFLSTGVIGFVLPVILGVPFQLAAIALLGPSHPRVRLWIKRIQQWCRLARKYGT